MEHMIILSPITEIRPTYSFINQHSNGIIHWACINSITSYIKVNEKDKQTSTIHPSMNQTYLYLSIIFLHECINISLHNLLLPYQYNQKLMMPKQSLHVPQSVQSVPSAQYQGSSHAPSFDQHA